MWSLWLCISGNGRNDEIGSGGGWPSNQITPCPPILPISGQSPSSPRETPYWWYWLHIQEMWTQRPAFVSRLERSPVISDVWDMISSSLIRACTAPLAVQRIIYHNYRIFLIENIRTFGPKYHNIFIALQTVQCSVVESSQSSQDAPSTISKHTMNPTVMWRDEYLMHQKWENLCFCIRVGNVGPI